MNYDLEAINTLFAQIAECMHRNPARAMRLLGQAKAKVREALERAANNQAVRLAVPLASAEARNAALEEAAQLCEARAGSCDYAHEREADACADAIRELKSTPAADPVIRNSRITATDGKTRVVGEHLTGGCLNWDDGEAPAKGAGDGDLHFIAGTIVLHLKGPVDPAGVIAASRSIKAWIDRQQRGGDVGSREARTTPHGLVISDDPVSAIECCITDYENETPCAVNNAILSGLRKARAALAAQRVIEVTTQVSDEVIRGQAELAVSNGECAAQVEMPAGEPREAMVRNVAARMKELLKLIPPAASAEPVAWKWRRHARDDWHYDRWDSIEADAAKDMEAKGWEVVRLYDAPSANLAAHKPDGGDEKDAERLYYLQDRRSYVGNCPLWWAMGGNGYTTRLDQAHRYTFDEAMRQHRSRPSDVPWPCDRIDKLRHPTVDVQDMGSVDAQVAAIAQQGKEGA